MLEIFVSGMFLSFLGKEYLKNLELQFGPTDDVESSVI